MKKVTMKDIANKANVSVATVSYVLNNVEGQSIPEATRVYIKQIAKELQYVPNLAARSLIMQKSGLIGILINKTAAPPYWKQQRYAAFLDGLERRLTAAGYHTLLYSLDADQPVLDVIIERKLEAAFLLDVKEDQFYNISIQFKEGVPLLLVDSLVNDALFNQINYDLRGALLQAAEGLPLESTCLIMEGWNNLGITQYIRESLNLPEEQIYIVRHPGELKEDLLRRTNKLGTGAVVEGEVMASYSHIIAVNELIGCQLERLVEPGNLTVVCTCGCPELLDSRTRTVRFQGDLSQLAFDRMRVLLAPGEPLPVGNNQFYVPVE